MLHLRLFERLTNAWTTIPALGGCTSSAPTSAATVGGPDAYWQTYTLDDTGNRTTLVKHSTTGGADTTTNYVYNLVSSGNPPHILKSTSTTGATSGSSSYGYGGAGQQITNTINGTASDLTWTNQGSVKTIAVHAAGGDQLTTYYYDAEGNELLRINPTSRTLYVNATEITTNATGNTITGTTRAYICAGNTVASRANPVPYMVG